MMGLDREHYWIIAKENGKPYLIYGCPARDGEDAARTKGLEMLGGLDFQIKRFPTKDLSRASAMYRGKRLQDTKSLTEASRRIGHNKSIKRLRERDNRFKDLFW